MQIQTHPSSRTKKGIHADKHDLLYTVLKVLLVPATTFMLWKALSVATDSRYPIVVVISQSMEPAFRRGDLLLLQNRKHSIEVGDIPVCWFPGNPLPMVHRAISVMYTESCSDSNIIV
jgi:signal peptidase